MQFHRTADIFQSNLQTLHPGDRCRSTVCLGIVWECLNPFWCSFLMVWTINMRNQCTKRRLQRLIPLCLWELKMYVWSFQVQGWILWEKVMIEKIQLVWQVHQGYRIIIFNFEGNKISLGLSQKSTDVSLWPKANRMFNKLLVILW